MACSINWTMTISDAIGNAMISAVLTGSTVCAYKNRESPQTDGGIMTYDRSCSVPNGHLLLMQCERP